VRRPEHAYTAALVTKILRAVPPGTPATGVMARLLVGPIAAKSAAGLRLLQSNVTGLTGLAISSGVARIRLTGGAQAAYRRSASAMSSPRAGDAPTLARRAASRLRAGPDGACGLPRMRQASVGWDAHSYHELRPCQQMTHEEHGGDGQLNKTDWVLDPIDGTINFAGDSPCCHRGWARPRHGHEAGGTARYGGRCAERDQTRSGNGDAARDRAVSRVRDDRVSRPPGPGPE
jgi:Inositol monophosphatase family